MNNDIIVENLLPTQAKLHIINANTAYCLWPRGSGKTTRGIGPRIVHLNEVMPKSQVLLFSDSYKRLKERIVPNIDYFLRGRLKWIEGVDYVKFKKPPAYWEQPEIRPDEFDNVISTRVGLAICLVSLSIEGSANAFNAVAGIGDEVKYCNDESIESEVLPALGRSMGDLYGDMPEYGSVWMFSDKLHPKINWLLKKKKLMKPKEVDCVLALQKEIFDLEQTINQYSSETTRRPYKERISLCKSKADAIRREMIYYSDMAPRENEAAVGEQFFRKAKSRTRSVYIYNVAYENEDPSKVEHSFYPTFTEHNKYSSLKDYNPNLPIIIAMDYNFAFSPLPVAQISALPGNTFESLNIIDYLYQFDPKGTEDTVLEFCEKYKSHINRNIFYIFDHTAVGRSASKKVYRKIVENTLKNNKWNVIVRYLGKASLHNERYKVISEITKKRGYMSVLINKNTCGALITSIEGAGAITKNGLTQKDKRPELNKSVSPEDATHGSESFDQLLLGVNSTEFNYQIENTSNNGIIIL